MLSHKDRVLVPLLMYASGLFCVVEPHLPEAHAFADDSQLYVSFQPTENTNETAAITAMQTALNVSKNGRLPTS